MSDMVTGILIGGAFGFPGALIGAVVNVMLVNRKSRLDRTQELRLRLVGCRAYFQST